VSRADARRAGAAALTARGIPWESHHAGVPLRLTLNGRRLDYWPGTGRWKDPKSGQTGRDLASLLIYLGAERPE